MELRQLNTFRTVASTLNFRGCGSAELRPLQRHDANKSIGG
ncbi:hypothetical protein ABES78_19745 [Bacillus gobiensis]